MSYTMTEQGPNIRSNDMRNRRIGDNSNFPYRDDLNAPVHLESYTRGGYGPSHLPNALDDERKGKANRASSKNPCTSCLSICCDTQQNNDPSFYRDEFNDLSWSCSPGTTEESGIWLNQSDPAGSIMAFMVWFLLGYSAFTMTFLAETGGIANGWSNAYSLLVALALSAHIKTSLTDPGTVPPSAVPTEAQRASQKLSICSQCQTFKPPHSHHCRICNRCISRMDHHCPWMNNCVGAGNMKHFVLFLAYTWSCSTFSLLLLGFNYFFCASDDCVFNFTLTQLVRFMTILSVGAFMFTSSMLMNITYGLMTGIGTIDRLKKKATNTMNDSEEEPIPLKDVFGIGPLWTWPLPMDPIFEDYDRVMGYSTPQRMLREQILREGEEDDGASSWVGTPGSAGPPPYRIAIPPV